MLVTGGTGYIGSHLVPLLVERGARVRLVARNKHRISAEAQAESAPVEWTYADFEQPASLRGVCAGIDTVFHLAGFAHAETKGGPIEQTEHWRVTVEGTRALLAEASAAGVRRLVFVSSVKAMGEGGDRSADETTPAEPVSVYGIAKREAERLVFAAAQAGPMEAAVLRLPMVYGEGSPGNLSRMIEAIDRGRFPPLPDVHNRRSMVYVGDVAQALLLLGADSRAAGQVYLVTDGQTYSARQLYELISRALGKQPTRRAIPLGLLRVVAKVGDLLRQLRLSPPFDSDALQKLVGSACYSDARIRRELGFVSTHTLENSLAGMITEYRVASGSS